ncbi:hypothetical protein F5883DRAFT_204464 [Diaporthe sp. PMI_573]|nr:hypothetical protein F5883DRAFT_204464 [Diaporthaceae sp. PMI_573]
MPRIELRFSKERRLGAMGQNDEPSRIRFLKANTQNKMRVGAKAAVYVTAVLDYLTAEVLELAGVSSDRLKKMSVGTRSGPETIDLHFCCL